MKAVLIVSVLRSAQINQEPGSPELGIVLDGTKCASEMVSTLLVATSLDTNIYSLLSSDSSSNHYGRTSVKYLLKIFSLYIKAVL